MHLRHLPTSATVRRERIRCRPINNSRNPNECLVLVVFRERVQPRPGLSAAGLSPHRMHRQPSPSTWVDWAKLRCANCTMYARQTLPERRSFAADAATTSILHTAGFCESRSSLTSRSWSWVRAFPFAKWPIVFAARSCAGGNRCRADPRSLCVFNSHGVTFSRTSTHTPKMRSSAHQHTSGR